MISREQDLVELVDEHGTGTGTATVADAHEAPGLLHRAFSLFLRDPSGRVLLQQRAAVKTRFPMRWGNTCCGHPSAGEEVTVSAGRRLTEELGVTATGLREVGVYVYFAADPVTGRVEREYDHVLLGEIPAGVEFRPDPGEVARLRWVTVDELLGEIDRSPETYAPWLGGVTRQLAAALSPPVTPGPSPDAAAYPVPTGPAAAVGSPDDAKSPESPGSPESPRVRGSSDGPGSSDVLLSSGVPGSAEGTATERPGGQ